MENNDPRLLSAEQLNEILSRVEERVIYGEKIRGHIAAITEQSAHVLRSPEPLGDAGCGWCAKGLTSIPLDELRSFHVTVLDLNDYGMSEFSPCLNSKRRLIPECRCGKEDCGECISRMMLVKVESAPAPEQVIEEQGREIARLRKPAEPLVDEQTYRCFHCEEVFTDRQSAWVHFGPDQDCEKLPPACIDPLRADESARFKELREAQQYAFECQERANALEDDNDRSLLETFKNEIGHLFGKVGGVTAGTPHQAWFALDYERGLVLAAAERESDLRAQLAAARQGLKEKCDASESLKDMLANQNAQFRAAQQREKEAEERAAKAELKAAIHRGVLFKTTDKLKARISELEQQQDAGKKRTEVYIWAIGIKDKQLYDLADYLAELEQSSEARGQALSTLAARTCGSNCNERYTEKTVIPGVDPKTQWCAACIACDALATPATLTMDKIKEMGNNANRPDVVRLDSEKI